jgi:MSHA biogenesis protein MshE
MTNTHYVHKKIRLGDLLVEQKIISQAQLEEALVEQKKSGRKLGRVLVESGYVGEERLLDLLSRQLNIPHINLNKFPFKSEVVHLIPEIYARRFRAVALFAVGDTVLVGMSDPTNIFAYDEIVRIVGKPVQLAVVSEEHLLQTLDHVYRKQAEINAFAEQLHEELAVSDRNADDILESAGVGDAPVVKLLQSLFEDALQIGASDIHIEPDETELRVRLRVDGQLQEQIMDEKRIAQAIVLRLKLMAGLNVAEKRIPQDGRVSINVKSHNLDVRISTMPTQHGESIVMRLLDQSAGVLTLDKLGMPTLLQTRFEAAIRRPYGMVLVTGPTGSGKTTTIYSALQLLNEAKTKIITVEDPVEYRLPRLNQVQVNAEIGLTFAKVLRSALRQDPDVILVGEMRDTETAEIGVRAALTGHLLLSSLHTNDAVSAITRLIDMGVPSYLLASALHAVVAQRLVRKVCPDCRGPATLTPQISAWLRANNIETSSQTPFVHGSGCNHCNFTGYRGRIGVYELLEIDEAMARALARDDISEFTACSHRAPGFRSLSAVALDYALQGLISVDEVLRISAQAPGTLEVPANPPAFAVA